MDQSTHDVRRANWFNIITECQQRPVDVSVKQWLADNGIKEKAYYYWLRKFRREACEQMNLPAVTAPAELSFAEIPIPTSAPARNRINTGCLRRGMAKYPGDKFQFRSILVLVCCVGPAE